MNLQTSDSDRLRSGNQDPPPPARIATHFPQTASVGVPCQPPHKQLAMRRVFACNIIQLRSHISMLQSAADSQHRTPYRAHITSPDSKGENASQPGKHGQGIHFLDKPSKREHFNARHCHRRQIGTSQYAPWWSREGKQPRNDTEKPCRRQTMRLQLKARSVTVVRFFIISTARQTN